MASLTNRYGLQELDAGDALSKNGYAFTNGDRQRIDQLLYIGAEGHRHTGGVASVSNPTDPLTAVLDTSFGNIPAGQTVSYKYTLVDESGAESAPSPEVSVNTPPPVSAPGAVGLSRYLAGGTMTAGNYYYGVSAYKDAEILETRMSEAAFVTLSSTSTTWRVELELPGLPSGADGFNVFRRGPGESKYSFMESIDMQVATPASTWVDTGAIDPNCNRLPSSLNTTNSANQVILGFPGATPSVPEGFTWRVYRTYTVGNYQNSKLAWVVEETFEGSGVVTAEFTDIGLAASAGGPPDNSEFVAPPAQIDLATEVDGLLPMSKTASVQVATFAFPGELDFPKVGSFVWICEYERAEILGVRATLGRDSSPSTDPVLVDVNKWDGVAWTTMFTNQANRASIAVGEQFGVRATPDVVELTLGDAMTVDIDQVGGGATPNDFDLIVTIYMIGVEKQFDNLSDFLLGV